MVLMNLWIFDRLEKYLFEMHIIYRIPDWINKKSVHTCNADFNLNANQRKTHDDFDYCFVIGSVTMSIMIVVFANKWQKQSKSLSRQQQTKVINIFLFLLLLQWFGIRCVLFYFICEVHYLYTSNQTKTIETRIQQ